MSPDEKYLVDIKSVISFFCFTAISNVIPHYFESLQETCIVSLKSFEPMVTKLCSGQEMLYKSNQRGIIKKQGRVMVLVHCTSRHCQKHAYQVWSHLDL